MKEHAFRLLENEDLRKGIETYCATHQIHAGVILSAVGCVKALALRKAKALETYHDETDYEIVSLIGTIAKNGVHLHASFADESMRVIGGHLLTGTIVNTTAEIVLGELEQYDFLREYDEKTGYKELTIRQK